MAESADTKIDTKAAEKKTPVVKAEQKRSSGPGNERHDSRRHDRRGGDKNRRRRRRRGDKPQSEFDQKLVEIRRVTRVTRGGKKMRFSAAVLVGNKKGKVGFGVAKGADTSLAIDKAVRQAKKNLIQVPIVKGSLPHDVKAKSDASVVLLKKAPVGTGIIAGGTIRAMAELAGIKNLVAKSIASKKSKLNTVRAGMAGLRQLRSRQQVLVARGLAQPEKKAAAKPTGKKKTKKK